MDEQSVNRNAKLYILVDIPARLEFNKNKQLYEILSDYKNDT